MTRTAGAEGRRPARSGYRCGDLVDESAAQRIESWIGEARDRGAAILTGGNRSGAQLDPTVVIDAPLDSRLVCDEIFGPVVVILLYDDIDEAIAQANATPYGLPGAVFTASLDVALAVPAACAPGACW